MQISSKGIDLTETAEGCRLKAYQDTGGVWTIGYGHTDGVKSNQIISRETAEMLLKHDLEYAQNIVNQHGGQCTQVQFDALCDFVFNVGPTQFLSSHLFTYHVAGEYEKAAAEFPKWKYDNGKVIRGLVVRRIAEQALYNLQEQSTDHPNTVLPVRSDQSTAGSVSASPVLNASQSSPAPIAPASSTVQASRSTPSGLLARALAILHKLSEGKAPSEN